MGVPLRVTMKLSPFSTDTATVDKAERAAEMAIKQGGRLIEVHDPVVPDTGVGVLMSLDDVVEALRTG